VVGKDRFQNNRMGELIFKKISHLGWMETFKRFRIKPKSVARRDISSISSSEL